MNADKMLLSKLADTDLPALRDISISTFYEAFIRYNTEQDMQDYISKYFSAEKLLEELRNPQSEFYFAILDGRPVGYLKINFGYAQTDLKDGNSIEIERIYVLKELRGKNIGQFLFDKAVQLAKEKGLDYLWLGVWENNPGAIKFYERNGMVKFAEHPFMLGNDQQTDHLMRMNIVYK